MSTITSSSDRVEALVEVGDAAHIFVNPADQRTEDYITGRFG